MATITRTQQPCDADLDLVRFPCGVSIKYDGVKLCRIEKRLIGRSFKAFRNAHLNMMFDNDLYEGFEGEVVVGNDFFANNLCRATTSAVNTLEGEPDYKWLVFDYVKPETINLTYDQRMSLLIDHCYAHGLDTVIVVVKIVNNLEELLEFEQEALAKGAEGIIIRDMQSTYKQGRVTPRSQEVLRLKRFKDEEGEVLELIEGSVNNNEATINELGLTERSSHKENLTPNGMVGSLVVRCLSDGEIDTISAGAMTHEERKFYFENPDQIIGKTIKFSHFPVGRKDKKRFPQFVGFRIKEDME